MRISRAIAALDGVVECGLMMGTPANLAILRGAGILGADGTSAGPGDLVIAIGARDQVVADAALASARENLETISARTSGTSAWAPRSIRAAVAANPKANLALISVPGAFAAAEARKALSRGVNVMMFSDNVPVEDEVTLKSMARQNGLLMMGPDCGTAIINGAPLGFANAVPRGAIGIIGASGTGIQEVSCLIANNGGGVSHAIGVGGRDLKAEVGGITTLMAIDLLDADPATERVVLVSKPPAPEVAKVVLERVRRATKPCVICFLGGGDVTMPANARAAATLHQAAALALGHDLQAFRRDDHATAGNTSRKLVRGLFAGGTLCAEAQVVLRDAGLVVASNAPIPGGLSQETPDTHLMLDLGDDAYTLGRPHPMIEPAVRDAPFRSALADPAVGAILVDLVLGHGSHVNPAAALAEVMRTHGATDKALIVSITGTAGDPQDIAKQQRDLQDAGFVVVTTGMGDAATLVLRSVGRER